MLVAIRLTLPAARPPRSPWSLGGRGQQRDAGYDDWDSAEGSGREGSAGGAGSSSHYPEAYQAFDLVQVIFVKGGAEILC